MTGSIRAARSTRCGPTRLRRSCPISSEARRPEKAVGAERLERADRLCGGVLLAQQPMGIELAQRQVQGKLELAEALRRPVVGGSRTVIGIERRQARQ